MSSEFTIQQLAKLASGFAAIAHHDARVHEKQGVDGDNLAKVQKYARKCRAMADALKQQVSPWIDVNDRLPDRLQQIFWCYQDGQGPSSWYKYPTTMHKGDFFRHNAVHGEFRIDMRPIKRQHQVRYWMPVPPAPNSI